jgi:micrococcal nuclease
LLRYVFVGDIFVNYELVRRGYAQAKDYPPDTACSDTFHQAENTSKQDEIGIWQPTATPRPTPLPTSPPLPTNTPATGGTGGDSGGGDDDGGNCHPSYPSVCIPPPPPDLNCGDISYNNFQVVGSDPHRFDGDNDGIGCEQ